jgi:hypothetical protein
MNVPLCHGKRKERREGIKWDRWPSGVRLNGRRTATTTPQTEQLQLPMTHKGQDFVKSMGGAHAPRVPA